MFGAAALLVALEGASLWPALAEGAQPPEIRLLPMPERIVVAEPFELGVSVEWRAGSGGSLRPPTLAPSEHVRVVRVGSEGRSGASEDRVDYRITLVIDRSGRHEIGPIEVRWAFEDSPPEIVRLAVPGLEVASPPVERWLAWGLGGVALLAIGAGLVMAVRGKRGTASQEEALARRASGLREQLDRARRERARGDESESLVAMLRLLDELPQASDSGGENLGGVSRAEVEAALERARFGGETVPRMLFERLDQEAVRRIRDFAEPLGAGYDAATRCGLVGSIVL